MSRYSRAWIIDDSEMDNFLNKMILQTIRYASEIESYCNPVKALDRLRDIDNRKAKEEAPEIVFLDINMPLMNGFEFLKEFEALSEEIRDGIRFFLISSSEDPEDVERIKKFPQILRFLNKPLDKNQLI